VSDIRIEVGDRVTVRFENMPNLSGEVLYMPQDTGDCWVIKDKDGTLYHIQNFAFIFRGGQ